MEAVGPVGEGLDSTVYISPDEQKIKDFLEIQTLSSKKECQMIAGCAAQLKRFCLVMQLQYPGIMQLCSPNVRFQWNPDLQKELDDLKKCLKKHIKLSPIDINKNLKLIIDAAVAEVASLRYACQKENHFLRWSQHTTSPWRP